jgi:hypothetical protein
MALPDCQEVGIVEGELVLTTHVLGGLIVSHACGFESYRPMGIRRGGWTAADADAFASRMLESTRLEM